MAVACMEYRLWRRIRRHAGLICLTVTNSAFDPICSCVPDMVTGPGNHHLRCNRHPLQTMPLAMPATESIPPPLQTFLIFLLGGGLPGISGLLRPCSFLPAGYVY